MKQLYTYIIEKLKLNKDSKEEETVYEKIIRICNISDQDVINIIVDWVLKNKINDINIYLTEKTAEKLLDKGYIERDEFKINDTFYSYIANEIYNAETERKLLYNDKMTIIGGKRFLCIGNLKPIITNKAILFVEKSFVKEREITY